MMFEIYQGRNCIGKSNGMANATAIAYAMSKEWRFLVYSVRGKGVETFAVQNGRVV